MTTLAHNEIPIVVKALDRGKNADRYRTAIGFMRASLTNGTKVQLYPETVQTVAAAIDRAVADKIYSPDELPMVRDLFVSKLARGSKLTGPAR